MFSQSYANQYKEVGIQTGLNGASPAKITIMLYDGVIAAINKAGKAMVGGNITEKGEMISKAVDIIQNGLRVSLDKKAGGEIAQNLDDLYGFMISNLYKANIKNNPAILKNIIKLLQDLREAWVQIDKTNPNAASAKIIGGHAMLA